LGADVFRNEEKGGKVMNQIFSFKRYWWLVKRQWYENAAIYKWGIVLMVFITGFAFWLIGNWKPVDFPVLQQKGVFYLTVSICLFIYGANFFRNLSSKHKKMSYFSLPVSQLERIAVAFTYVMVFMPVFMLSVFTVFDILFVQLFNHIHGVSEQMIFMSNKPFGLPNSLLMITLFHLSIISIFAFGSL
jgi:hypothetical protein